MRGSTNHSSRPSSSVSTTWVCGGRRRRRRRSAPARSSGGGSSSTRPSRAGAGGTSRAVGAPTTVPVSPSISASATCAARRARARPRRRRSAGRRDAAATPGAPSRPRGARARASADRSQAIARGRLLGRLLRPAVALAEDAPSISTARERLGVVGPARGQLVHGRAAPGAGRGSWSCVLWSSSSSRPSDSTARARPAARPSRTPRRARRRGRPRRARPRRRRTGSTASRAARRRLAPPSRMCGPRSISSATSASATALTTLLRRSVSDPRGVRRSVGYDDVGDDPAEHGVAEELEPLVAVGARRLGAPRAMGHRPAQQATSSKRADAVGERREPSASAVTTEPVSLGRALVDVVDGVADGLEVFEVLVFDAEADVRSPSSSSSASTSSISASESASRSSTNDCPSLIVDGSISRMSASGRGRSEDLVAADRTLFHMCLCWHGSGV